MKTFITVYAAYLGEVGIYDPFLSTHGFANQGSSFLLCSFPILPNF